MTSSTNNSSIVIDSDIETVWNVITQEDQLTQWYAPDSPWNIPNLIVGEKVIFTLKPSVHNNLKEEFPMSLKIKKLILKRESSLYIDAQQMLLSFTLNEEGNGIRVRINSEGFQQSLANLKAIVEGREIPYV